MPAAGLRTFNPPSSTALTESPLLSPPSLSPSHADITSVPRTCPANVHLQPFAHTLPSAWSLLLPDLRTPGSHSLFRPEFNIVPLRSPPRSSCHVSPSPGLTACSLLSPSRPSSWPEISLLIHALASHLLPFLNAGICRAGSLSIFVKIAFPEPRAGTL